MRSVEVQTLGKPLVLLFLPALIIDDEITNTNTCFLALGCSTCRYSSPFCDRYNTGSYLNLHHSTFGFSGQ